MTKEELARKLEVILKKQEYVLQYIDLLHQLSDTGGVLAMTARNFHNEIQLSLAGVKIAEKQ